MSYSNIRVNPFKDSIYVDPELEEISNHVVKELRT